MPPAYYLEVSLLDDLYPGFYLNSGENLSGQDCADPDNWDDRILAPITGPDTLLHCYNSCETDGSCPTIDPIDVYADPSYVDGDGNSLWGGYVTWYNLEADGSQGDYVSGDFWGLEDVATTLNTDPDYMTITLEPNYNLLIDEATNDYWVDQTTGEGTMYLHGTSQVESWDAYNGADLTFSGYVYHNDLSADFTANYFIKCLNPNTGWNDILNGAYEFTLPAAGEMFTVTVPGTDLPAGTLVQFGFTVYGAMGDIADQAANGSVILGADADAPMSINDPDDVLNLRIYPNPVNDGYVNILSPVNGVKYVEIFDINGRKVLDTNINNTMLDVSSINSGFYMIKVTIDGQSKISKLVVR